MTNRNRTLAAVAAAAMLSLPLAPGAALDRRGHGPAGCFDTRRPLGSSGRVEGGEVHGLPLIGHSKSSLRFPRRRRRAWWRCDRTVPAASPRCLAISSCFQPSRSCSSTTSR